MTGLVGGLIGAAIWAALIYFTGVEIGYVAILVGACAGIGVRLGASQWDFGMGTGPTGCGRRDRRPDRGEGVGGRMYLNKELGEIRALAMQFQHDNHLIAEMADEIWEDSPEGTPLSNPNWRMETTTLRADPQDLSERSVGAGSCEVECSDRTREAEAA